MGRPACVEEKEVPDREGCVECVFRCSREQLFNYFKRFNPGEAEVVSPKKLRDKLYRYHLSHLEAMRKDGKKEGGPADGRSAVDEQVEKT